MRKLQSQGVVLYQSVSLKPITSSGATYVLRAKSRKEVDAAATAKTKDGAKHGDRESSKCQTTVVGRIRGETLIKCGSGAKGGRSESRVDFEAAFSARQEGDYPKV